MCDARMLYRRGHCADAAVTNEYTIAGGVPEGQTATLIWSTAAANSSHSGVSGMPNHELVPASCVLSPGRIKGLGLVYELGPADGAPCVRDGATVPLSGGNDDNARNLQACVGECDNDGQCAAGLKCFQRTNGEAIPGCTGDGGGKTWDYCYAPDATISQAECVAAGAAVLPAGKSHGRSMAVGGWGHVPPGCTVQSKGDWTVHYNTCDPLPLSILLSLLLRC